LDGTYQLNGGARDFIPPTSGDYWFVFKVGIYDAFSADVVIDELLLEEVSPKPYTDFSASNNIGFAPLTVQFANLTKFATSYEWDFGDGSPKVTDFQPSYMYLKEGNYTITLTVRTNTDPECVSVLTLPNAIELKSAGDIILPNAFKPDPSGPRDEEILQGGYRNDLFYPPVLSPVDKYLFVIYNRAGQKIFETDQPTRGWNGYFRGRLCDEGAYFYKVEGVFTTGQSFYKMGDITLIR
jgi:hypothetical protein